MKERRILRGRLTENRGGRRRRGAHRAPLFYVLLKGEKPPENEAVTSPSGGLRSAPRGFALIFNKATQLFCGAAFRDPAARNAAPYLERTRPGGVSRLRKKVF